MEDDNLFKIHLVDEDAINLKKIKLESLEKYKEPLAAIEEVSSSVAILDKSRDLVMERYQYLSSNINNTAD